MQEILSTMLQANVGHLDPPLYWKSNSEKASLPFWISDFSELEYFLLILINRKPFNIAVFLVWHVKFIVCLFIPTSLGNYKNIDFYQM